MKQMSYPVTELVEQCCDHLEQLGYSKPVVWGSFYSHYMYVARFHLIHEAEEYDPVIADQYLKELLEQYDQGTVSYCKVREIQKVVEHLNEFSETGKITRLQVKKGSQYVLTERSESLLQGFLNSKPFHPNTREDFAWAIKLYLSFFQNKGKDNVETVSNDDIRVFIVETSKSLSSGSLQNVVCYLKQFYQYLEAQGMDLSASSQTFQLFRIKRENHINSYVSDEEAEKIIAAIDSCTPKGKRNLAVILLGYFNGIRAADIASLRLSDINWEAGKIRIQQQKTGHYVEYPLIKKVAEALKDYIINARPSCDYQEVFLRVFAPIRPLVSGASIEHIFRYQCKVAGIERKPFDGKAFHGLRRRLGRRMLLSGAPLSTIAQTLGHTDLQSARQYMKINADELRECSLDFSGIPVKRRALL